MMDRPWVIFDMDGTLIDSMPYWDRLTDEYLDQMQLSEKVKTILRYKVQSMSMLESAALFKEVLDLPHTPVQIELEMGDIMDRHYQEDIPLKPGVKAYLQKLREQDVAMCVATLTPVPLARACLERLGIADYFVFILSCDDVGAGKDQPYIYLQAAWEFGADPSEVAVFEDAHYAARTAKQAGFWVVGMYDETHAKHWPEMQYICDETIQSWDEALQYL